MSPEEAERLQYLYHMGRREYVADPELGLIPYPEPPQQNAALQQLIGHR